MKKNYLILSLLVAFSWSSNAQAEFGNLDATFSAGSGPDDYVQSIVTQRDRKIILGGNFLTYSGTNSKRIVRLNPDGSVDGSFITGSGANKVINSVIIQEDGKILISGGFSVFNNTSKKRIARLQSDGSFDPTFNIGLGANERISSCILQPDGKIVIGGSFTSFNWQPKNGIARLNSDGSIDESFINDPTFGAVSNIKMQSDGKLIVNTTGKLLRLNSNGTLDDTFNTGVGAEDAIKEIMIQSNGKILLGGFFTTFDGHLVNRLVRLNSDGTVDTSFNVGTGADYGVLSISEQPDGMILLSGIFTMFNGVRSEKLVRLSPDGEVDSSFNPMAGPDDIVVRQFLQPDGKVIIAGEFNNYDGVPCNKLARINGFTSTLSLTKNVSKKAIIFPNPVKSRLKIELPDGAETSMVSIIDLTGKTVLKKTSGNLHSIDVTSLAGGMYVLSASSPSGQFNSKFIKQ